MKISQNFVAFSVYTNFTTYDIFIPVPIPNNMEVLGEVVPAATVGVAAEVLSEVPGVPPKPPTALEVFPITIQKL